MENKDQNEQKAVSSRTITSCEHFDEIRFKPEDQFTDADFQFMAEHIDSCPLGIHTEEALDRFLNMSPEEIESKILADTEVDEKDGEGALNQ